MGEQLAQTIKKYLVEKVREKFPDDFHLLEPLMDDLTSRYSLKELYIVCSVELSRIRQTKEGSPEMRTEYRSISPSKPD